MLKELGGGITAIFASIIGLATLAVILSDKANTQGVISSIGAAFAGLIGAATGPITGATGTAGTAGYTVPSFASGSSYATNVYGSGGGSVGISTPGLSLSVPASVVNSGISGLGSLFGGGGDVSGSDAWSGAGTSGDGW